MIRLLRRLVLHVFGDAPDPAWRASGLKFTTARGYDEAKAIAASRRARRRSATGRPFSRRKDQKPNKVTPFPLPERMRQKEQA